MAIGGYTTAIMSADHHTNLIATLPLAFAIAFACGLLVGLPALRFSGVYLALATFALAVSVPQLPLKFSKFTRRQQRHPHRRRADEPLALRGRPGRAARSSSPVAWLLLRGRIGRAFRAVRDSEVAATSSGVELSVYKTLAFGVSAAYAGVAGSLFVLATNGFAQPNEFGILLSLKILIGAAVAGLGSLWGVLVGRRLHRHAARDLVEHPARRLEPRAGRRLRTARDARHAPAPDRGRRDARRGSSAGSGADLNRDSKLLYQYRIRSRHSRYIPTCESGHHHRRRADGNQAQDLRQAQSRVRRRGRHRGERGVRRAPDRSRDHEHVDQDRRHVPAHRAGVAVQDDSARREGVLRRTSTPTAASTAGRSTSRSSTTPTTRRRRCRSRSSSSSRTRSSRSWAASAPRRASRRGGT